MFKTFYNEQCTTNGANPPSPVFPEGWVENVSGKEKRRRNKMKKGTFTDPRDGKVYKIVKIGNQVWMAENLAYDAPSSKCLDEKSDNCQKYGRLYDWETAKKVCPPGWHLPSKEEWQELLDFAGGDRIAGRKLKAKNGWHQGNGTDDLGFSALPGGYCNCSFGDVDRYGKWWSADECNNKDAYSLGMCFNKLSTKLVDFPKNFLFSVRCLQDKVRKNLRH
jgi:uncharacterized protein (TIGR02145 family)